MWFFSSCETYSNNLFLFYLQLRKSIFTVWMVLSSTLHCGIVYLYAIVFKYSTSFGNAYCAENAYCTFFCKYAIVCNFKHSFSVFFPTEATGLWVYCICVCLIHVCFGVYAVVLSKDPVLRYQVGTKKMKTSRYQVSLSPGGTEYPGQPGSCCVIWKLQMRSLHKSTVTGRHPKEEMHQTNNTLKTDTRIKWKSSSR